MEAQEPGKCIYILKTGKNLYKIGQTQDLQKRLAAYHTHLPVEFRIVRQYPADNLTELEESLHIVFQHKRVKGEWFELATDDLAICDNIARHYALSKLQKQPKKYPDLHYSNNVLLQVMEANEKYLNDYSKIAEDIKLGMTTQEIWEHYEGTVSKTIIETVRRLLHYQTPNSEFLSKWMHIVQDLEQGLTENEIIAKHEGSVSRSTVQMIRRILRNQLY